MAGTIQGQIRSTAPDVLFDLTPEDDKVLQESDLLQLVNYGQMQKPIKVPGTDGRTYTIEMALLWDEDYIDILRKTSSYSSDPILRVRIMRRLKLYKSIQKIDSHEYSNKEDIPAQRELWNILCRLADIQVEQLEALYNNLELERNVTAIMAMKSLSGVIEDTAPSDIKIKVKNSNKADITNDHDLLMKNTANKNSVIADSVEKAVRDLSEGKSSETPTTIKSPKQR